MAGAPRPISPQKSKQTPMPILQALVDLIRWNDAGLITVFKVMVRPLQGLKAVIPLMGEQLQKVGS